jgi:hypothetical protein
MEWFAVDKEGLAKILARKGVDFALFELVQNAWDADSTKTDITLARIPRTKYVELTVTDDNPEGFSNLAHAFTLFAESAKKGDATKRGRFNAGEKMVLALCQEATITSTKGSIIFDDSGRRSSTRSKTEVGTVVRCKLKMTDEEIERCEHAILTVIPPTGIATTFNGKLIPTRTPKKTITATLATEIADSEGYLRRSERKTSIDIFAPLAGEVASLYEMGIPVVDTGDKYSIVVQQKVPLSIERDNVTPAYLAKLRALVIEAMSADLTAEDANAAWVREAFQKEPGLLSHETVTNIIDLRFGEKRVAYDPSDREANHRAVAEGYVVVHGSQMSATEWQAARDAHAILPAGQVTPSPKPFHEDGQPLTYLPQDEWTPSMAAGVKYVQCVAKALIGESINVKLANEASWPFRATYGGREMTFNIADLGYQWFDGPLAQINDLVIHELGHHFSSNHLSEDYYRALTKLGARLVDLALAEPALFRFQREQVKGAGHHAAV